MSQQERRVLGIITTRRGHFQQIAALGIVPKIRIDRLAIPPSIPSSQDLDPVAQRIEKVFQRLQQVAQAHGLVGKVRAFRTGSPIEKPHLDTALREIAIFHVTMQNLGSYLGSSLGYDEDLYLHDQFRVKEDGYRERVRIEREPLIRDFIRRTNSLPIDIVTTSTYVSEGEEPVFGPAVFENSFHGSGITYLADLIHNSSTALKSEK